MTLNTTISRTQQSSTSSQNAAALHAATLSFGGKLSPSGRQIPNIRNPSRCLANRWDSTPRTLVGTRNALDCDSLVRGAWSDPPLLVAQQSFANERVQKSHPQPLANQPGSSLSSRSPTTMAAEKLAAAGLGDPPEKNVDKFHWGREEEPLPVKVTVNARQTLAQDDEIWQDDSSPLPITSVRCHGVLSTRSKSFTQQFEADENTQSRDKSSTKNLFQKTVPRQPATARSERSPAAIHAQKPTGLVLDSPSLIAAILATKLSPLNSGQISAGGSLFLKPISTSDHRTATKGSCQSHLGSHAVLPKVLLPSPYEALEADMSFAPSKESMLSMVSTMPNRNNTFLAATLASKPKTLHSPQTKPPKQHPARAQNCLKAATTSSNILVLGDDTDTVPLPMQLSTNQLSASMISFLTPPPPPPPRRSTGQLSRKSIGDHPSAALTATVFSAAQSHSSPTHPDHGLQHSSSLPRYPAGDSVRAASIAPSRVTYPAPKKPPAPPAPRRGRRKSPFPPPKPGLRDTMRKPPKTPLKEIGTHRHKPLLVKHLHKHSEGERRRWRHFVTEPERKRYEGLWAANKGLLLVDPNIDVITIASPSLPLPGMKSHSPHNFQQQQHVWSSTSNYTECLTDCINSLIARNIWARSRLSFDHLADIWDLVDRGEKGYLSRDEFVVGTWFIDQSLKGRKLPSRVQGEVWQSVRRLGVRIHPFGSRQGRNNHGQ